MTTGTESREQILSAFDALVKARKRDASRIALRDEEAAKAKDREVLTKASAYTVESIVKGLADLQLTFGNEIETIANGLKVEADKVGELKRAILVESQNLQELKNIHIAANAAFIRTREIEEKRAELDQWIGEKREDFDEDVTRQREAWAKEQDEHTAAVAEYEARLKKDREQDEADHKYDQERKHKVDADTFAQRKLKLERELAENQAAKEKDWAEREEALAKGADELAENQAKIDAFAEKLAADTEKARKSGISKANADAKVQAELLEKEMAASTQVFELKIESLEKVIGDQTAQIETLQAKLAVALERSQNLAVKAIEKSKDVAGA